MTPAERVEARKQARLNKQKPPEPSPSIFTETSRSRRSDAKVREAAVVPSAGYQLTPEEQARNEASGNKNFEDIFLSVIQFLPPDQQGRAFSLFSAFRQQKPEDQKTVIDSLMKIAQEQTGPLFDLYKKRIEQDTEYNKAALNNQLSSAKANYDRLVQTVDTNALRDTAKTDRNMAKVIRSITNTAFVDRVAGSGIQRRRTQEQIDEARLANEDIMVKANQTKGAAGQQIGQIERELQSKIDREDVLKERDVTDNAQKEEEANRSLFLSLFENQFANSGENARDNLESGDIDVTGGSSSADVRSSVSAQMDAFASGGTDAQRRARGNEEKRVANAKAEDARIAGLNQSYNDATGRMFQLRTLSAAMKKLGRSTSEVDAEIERLKPYAQTLLDQARAGKGTFQGSSGSGVSDLDYWLSLSDEAVYGKYGYGGMDRNQLNTYLDQTKGLLDTLGQDFTGLEKIPDKNSYGAATFNEHLRPILPRRGDVLTPAPDPLDRRPFPMPIVVDQPRRPTPLPVVVDDTNVRRDITIPGSGTKVDLRTRTYTGGKPLSRR